MLALARIPVALGRHTAKAAVRALLPKTLLFCAGSRKKPRVCLTFDDGPTELTGAYLDLLDSFGVRATFFLVGAACRERPDAVKDIAKRKHELAGHGYTHRAFPDLTSHALEQELERTARLLPAPSNRSLVRPPRGALSTRALVTCARSGFTTVLWSRDSNDCKIFDQRAIVEQFAADPALPGDVILFHEGQPWTLQALPPILTQLLEAGNELVTISELLGG